MDLSAYRSPLDALDWQLLQLWQQCHPEQHWMNESCQSWSPAEHQSLQDSIEQVFDRQLPLDQLNTPAELALAWRQTGIDLAASPELSFNQNDAHNPLFLIHPAIFDAYLYHGLAQHIHRPIIGLNRPDKATREAASNLKQHAQYYCDKLQQIQAHGPYHLGGWSLGGLIAMEMAEQLRAKGETVASISLIDPFFGIHERVHDYKQVFHAFSEQYPNHPHTLYLRHLPGQRYRAIIKDFLMHEIPLIHRFAFHSCDAPVLIIHSKDIKYDHRNDIQDHYRSNHCIDSECEHFLMLNEPALATIAAWINKHLDDHDAAHTPA